LIFEAAKVILFFIWAIAAEKNLKYFYKFIWQYFNALITRCRSSLNYFILSFLRCQKYKFTALNYGISVKKIHLGAFMPQPEKLYYIPNLFLIGTFH
jgi:hypothetical protein